MKEHLVKTFRVEKTIPNYRDTKLDILRGIGVLCIILAHVDPPGLIFQLRNFDVPLLVLVSGASYFLSNARNEKYGHYLFLRFVRLIIPTWIFLAVFFSLTFFASTIAKLTYPFSLQKVLSSFALMEGIGYLWIIRVFFLIAIISPLIKNAMSINRQALFWFFIGLLYIVYELAANYSINRSNELIKFILTEVVFYVMSYGLVAAIGMSMIQLNIKKRIIIALLLLLAFLFLVIKYYLETGHLVASQVYKYPPTFYYFSYALGVTFFLTVFVELSKIGSMLVGRIMAWIGRRTMWAYLWHIFILYLLSWKGIKSNFAVKFFIVFLLTFSIVTIQELSLEYLLSKVDNEATKKWLKIVFKG